MIADTSATSAAEDAAEADKARSRFGTLAVNFVVPLARTLDGLPALIFGRTWASRHLPALAERRSAQRDRSRRGFERSPNLAMIGDLLRLPAADDRSGASFRTSGPSNAREGPAP